MIKDNFLFFSLQILTNRQFATTDICNNETVPPCSAQEISSIFFPLGGRCNNVNNPILGTINRPYRRLLPPSDRNIVNTRGTLLNVRIEEEDAQTDIRKESSGKMEGNWLRPWPTNATTVNYNTDSELPNVRLVSRTFHSDQDVPSDRDQLFTMFGQFVCHDFIATAGQTAVSDCCTSASQTDFVNCLPIIVPAGDSFFNTSQCLDFKRSIIFCNRTGQNRHHINQLTAFVDAENIYGSDETRALSLRALSGGFLKESSPGRLLPKIGSPAVFTAGERRARENPALATIHTIFMREHNRIAALIAQRNPSLSDTEIYNQARRIVSAEYQNIVFDEFLPLLIGTKKLFPPGNSHTTYDPNVDPSITNEFSASALRFGHTTVTGFFNQNDPVSGQLLGGYLLRTSNNNVSIYSDNPDLGMTSIAKGMTLQAAQTFDNFVTKELTNFLYASATNNFAFGSDLAARNIQRGRDNGLPGWVNYRKVCTGLAPNNWNERPFDITAENWAKLRSLYVNVQDIDLFTGSSAEQPVSQGTLGVTSSCISANQFQRLILGDRYFFTHGGDVGAKFTKNQMKALRKVRMFDILCLNTNIGNLQKKAFKIANGSGNPLVSCTTAASIDVSLFV
jgi:peroxidase